MRPDGIGRLLRSPDSARYDSTDASSGAVNFNWLDNSVLPAQRVGWWHVGCNKKTNPQKAVLCDSCAADVRMICRPGRRAPYRTSLSQKLWGGTVCGRDGVPLARWEKTTLFGDAQACSQQESTEHSGG